MAGHSKWANIKHRKGAQDAKRGKIFTKIIKEITISAKSAVVISRPMPACVWLSTRPNRPTCRKTISTGRSRKGTGDLDGVTYEEGIFEGYGAGGVAVIVEFMDRQPHPYRCRCPSCLQQVWWEPRRQRFGRLYVRP